MRFLSKLLGSAVLLSACSTALSAMWVLPEIDEVKCPQAQFIYDGKVSLDTEPVNITPTKVFDQDVHSDLFGIVCAGQERYYRVSDLRQPCRYGWQAKIERLSGESGDTMSSHILCVGRDLFVFDIRLSVTAEQAVFESVGDNGGDVFVDAAQ